MYATSPIGLDSGQFVFAPGARPGSKVGECINPFFLADEADIVREIRGPEAETGFFSTGIHVTAVFACLVGYLLYRMADWTDHAFEDKHVYLPFIFVAVVYGYPLLMWLRAKAMDIFFDAVRTEDELGSHSGDPIERDANSGD